MFDNTFDGIAVVQGNAEGVDTCGQVTDVDNIAVVEDGDDASALVIDFNLIHFGWRNSDFAGSGVGGKSDMAKVVSGADAYFGDGQLQYDDAVASSLCLPFKEVLATFGVGVPVPSVAARGRVDNGVVGAVVDGEVEGDSAVAALRVGRCYRVDRGGSIDRIVPSVAVACGISDNGFRSGIDCEHKYYYRVTSIGVLQGVKVGALC